MAASAGVGRNSRKRSREFVALEQGAVALDQRSCAFRPSLYCWDQGHRCWDCHRCRVPREYGNITVADDLAVNAYAENDRVCGDRLPRSLIYEANGGNSFGKRQPVKTFATHRSDACAGGGEFALNKPDKRHVVFGFPPIAGGRIGLQRNGEFFPCGCRYVAFLSRIPSRHGATHRSRENIARSAAAAP